jgi:hypothetical protein
VTDKEFEDEENKYPLLRRHSDEINQFFDELRAHEQLWEGIMNFEVGLDE